MDRRAMARVRAEGHVSTSCTSARSRPPGPGAAAATSSALADLGITVDRDDADRRFSRQVRLGLRRRQPLRPHAFYGTPDDLRAFVDRAHALGLGVILDVVYNHVGPDGNYLADFSRGLLHRPLQERLGQALNFEGPAPARASSSSTTRRTGSRNSTSTAFASTRRRTSTTLARARARDHRPARAEAAPGGRASTSSPRTSRRTRGSFAAVRRRLRLDALWNDDYHHARVVALTGRARGLLPGLPRVAAGVRVSAAKYGYLYQGQWYDWQKQRRGTPALDLPPAAFVDYLENHDQVANSAFGRRLHQLDIAGAVARDDGSCCSVRRRRCCSRGRSFAASAPFLYFADHKAELREPILRWAAEFLSQFPSLSDPAAALRPPPPTTSDVRTVQARSSSERATRTAMVHAASRPSRCAATIRSSARRSAPPSTARSSVRTRSCCAIRAARRRSPADRQPRVRSRRSAVAEPLLAPPTGAAGTVQWSSEVAGLRRQRHAADPPAFRLHVPGECCRAPLRSGRTTTDDEEADGSHHDRHRPLPSPRTGRRRRSAAAPRVAGHERSRRLRVGHGRGRRDAPLSRPARRRAAGAAGPTRDAEPPARARPPAGSPACSGSATRTRWPARIAAIAPSTSSSSASSWVCPSGATMPGAVIEKAPADAVRAEHRPRHLPLLEGRTGASVAAPFVQFRGYEAAVDRIARPVVHADVATAVTKSRRRGDLPPLRLRCTRSRGADARRKGRRPRCLPMESSRGYEASGSLWSPGYFRADLSPDSRHAGAPRPSPGSDSGAVARRTPPRPRGIAAAADDDRRVRRCGSARRGAGARADDQFIITPGRTRRGSARARAAGDECGR